MARLASASMTVVLARRDNLRRPDAGALATGRAPGGAHDRKAGRRRHGDRAARRWRWENLSGPDVRSV